jgi:hypothetical protein
MECSSCDLNEGNIQAFIGGNEENHEKPQSGQVVSELGFEPGTF